VTAAWHPDAERHVRGESLFVDDLPVPEGTLHAAVCVSPVAHGRVRRVGLEAARAMPGVRGVFTAADVPGRNQIGIVIEDEPLLAEGEVHYIGQPIALVAAETPAAARRAARAIAVECDPLPAIFDPREAFRRGFLIAPARTFALGDVAAAWPQCARIVEGTAETGGQEHLYLEPQSALAVPSAEGLKIESATQAPTNVQRIVARVLGLPMNRVEVDVPRLGGGFGGKEDQATPWAALAALAAWRLRRPVKLVLRRGEDMRWTGKRHPYTADFRLGLAADGAFLAYEARLYQDAGATADLSTSVLERSLFHATNSYFIPNVRVTAASCRTHRAPNTAFRGFGAPQAVFVMEAAIARAAEAIGVEPRALQRRNLLRNGDAFPYGQAVRGARAAACWEALETRCDADRIYAEARAFNAAHRRHKKGIAIQPVCFGISFTNRFLNQAVATVHAYSDGSVGVSTGAVEMGQGVNAKLAIIAARALGIAPDRVRIESTNTTRAANTAPTAASSGADLNGHALRLACEELRATLRRAAAQRLGVADPARVEIEDGAVRLDGAPAGLGWEELTGWAWRQRIPLSAHAHYATPGLTFDPKTERGEAFAYHVFGAAVVEATVDGLRGTYTIDRVRLVHDAGRPLDERIDRGQVEGALCQGLGWMALEELRHAPDGRLLTDTLTTYKIPDLHWMPCEVAVHWLGEDGAAPGPYRSKAIGEPPFLYGIGAFFALREALRALRPDRAPPLSAPMTPERVLTHLVGSGDGAA